MVQTRYRSLSGTLIDLEKRQYTRDSDSETISSRTSRDVSESRMPMLGGPPKNKPSFAYHLPRRRFTRYFTISITCVLATFASYLVYASWTNGSHFISKHGHDRPPAFEQFPFLKRYHGGIRTLVDREANTPEYPANSTEIELARLREGPASDENQQEEEGRREKSEADMTDRASRFDPFEDRKSLEYLSSHHPPVDCFLDPKTKSSAPQLLSYRGVTTGFPDPVVGSHNLLGLRNDVCFERYGRLGPYGYGYSRRFGGSGAGMEGHKEGSEQVWDGKAEIDWERINWSQAQQACISSNQHRFPRAAALRESSLKSAVATARSTNATINHEEDRKTNNSTKQYLPRTAVVIRTWSDYEYDHEDLFYLRALINELAIQSGAEYVVHFLIHVRDDNKQIWSDEETYRKVLNASLPAEFRGMGTLWSERQMSLIYGGLDERLHRGLSVYGVYRSAFMPLQHFAHLHPEYDFFWNWEMDVRYTGHFYHLFNKVTQWAKQQPRKELWERSGRFYVPSEHGSWEDFRHMVRVQLQHGTSHRQDANVKSSQDAARKHPFDREGLRSEQPVWGPLRPADVNTTVGDWKNDPKPTSSQEADNYEWGVGEEADLITFNPIFDPQDTHWILGQDVTGYNESEALPPRRASIITTSRLSRRLLETMHRETALSRHTMASEMWPASCALHHGYKAVYAPHPVYIDRAWPTSYLAAIFNNGRNGASGGARTSIFSDERQVNFLGTSWYYRSGFAPNLWKRWLGYKVDNDGGEEWELANEGRMCVPAMLLHPVKQVDMVYEHGEREEDES